MEKLPKDQQIIAHPFLFKSKLGIGDDAYLDQNIRGLISRLLGSLSFGKFGAMIAGSQIITDILFPATTILGITLGTATAPIWFIIAAGMATGGAYFWMTSGSENGSDNKYLIIPRFINTPLDVLAHSLACLLIPLGIKIAALDGLVDENEKQVLSEHIIREWGYDPDYVEMIMALALHYLENYSISKLAETIAIYAEQNPDCNPDALIDVITKLGWEIAYADGRITPEEENWLSKLGDILRNPPAEQLEKHKREAKSFFQRFNT